MRSITMATYFQSSFTCEESKAQENKQLIFRYKLVLSGYAFAFQNHF